MSRKKYSLADVMPEILEESGDEVTLAEDTEVLTEGYEHGDVTAPEITQFTQLPPGSVSNGDGSWTLADGRKTGPLAEEGLSRGALIRQRYHGRY